MDIAETRELERVAEELEYQRQRAHMERAERMQRDLIDGMINGAAERTASETAAK